MGKYNLYENVKSPRDITTYTLMRGTTDWTQLQQFDMYEKGYPLLICVSIPDFLTKMAAEDEDINKLITAYTHIIEYEFKGLDGGLENMTGETSPISNGVQEMNVITKTTGQGASTFSMRYNERSGSIITKVNELYLRSVRDPATTFKHYGGLIGTTIDPEDAGFHKETFSFLYMHTDNTGLLLERAVYLVGMVPTSAELSIYNGEKGNVEFAEVSCEFSGFPIYGSKIEKRAKQILDWINHESNSNMLIRNSYDYKYDGIVNAVSGLAQDKLIKE